MGWGRWGHSDLELEGWRQLGVSWGGVVLWRVWKPPPALRSCPTLLLPASPAPRHSGRWGGGWQYDGLAFCHCMSPSSPLSPSTHTRQFYVSIQPPVGELMAPVFMSENEFKKEQGECSLGVDRLHAQGPSGLQHLALPEDPQLLHTGRPRSPQLLRGRDMSGRLWECQPGQPEIHHQ